jgi:hypothetical protein
MTLGRLSQDIEDMFNNRIRGFAPINGVSRHEREQPGQPPQVYPADYFRFYETGQPIALKK